MNNKSCFFTNHIKPEIKFYMCQRSLRHGFTVSFNNPRLNQNIRQEAKLTSDQCLGKTQQDVPPLSAMVGDDFSAVGNRFRVFVGGVTVNLTFAGLH